MAGLGFTLTPLLLAPAMIGLFYTALLTEPPTSVLFTAGTIIILVTVAVIARPNGVSLALETIGIAAWLLLPVPLGIIARFRAAQAEAATVRAEVAERTREEEARRRAAQERIRIARDLHDVVAHHLALANAQAGAASHLLDSDPEKSKALLSDLTATTSSALRELKATVGLLRQDNDTDSPLEPAPGLDRLPDLAASFHSTGLPIVVTVTGHALTLPPAVDLTAFRIIQEALTNSAKHAPTSTADVKIAYSPDVVRITVTNHIECQPTTNATPGYGLIGMRERALSVGGQFHAGQQHGTFEVGVELPTNPGFLQAQPPP
jgi:signal transduction histidine kinase